MKQETRTHRRPAALLLCAAAALPLTPLAAQDSQAPAEPAAQTPPAAETPAPPPPAPAPAQTPAPEATSIPVPEAAAPAPVTRRTTTTTRATTRAPAPRSVTRVPVRAPVAAPPAAAAPLAAPSADLAPLPVGTVDPAAAPEVLPETAPAPVAAQPAPAPAEDPRSGIISMLPWLIAGLALLGALAFLASRRRRRAHTEVHDESWQNEPAYAPAAEAHGGAVDESHPVEAHPVEAAPVAAVAAAPAAAAVASSGRPDIELRMRPVRAGVSENDARVEFELTVDNRGSAAAQELRVSTWMLAAGSSEAERALIQPGDDRADTPPVTIDAGETRTMEAAVALPTSQVEGDSVLPVVVADARYLLPDGSEEHRSVSFAVGVPVEGELAHFDMENPSGLHEGVEARPFARDRGD